MGAQVIETSAGVMTINRTLEDGGKTLKAHIVFKSNDGKELVSDRFFLRK